MGRYRKAKPAVSHTRDAQRPARCQDGISAFHHRRPSCESDCALLNKAKGFKDEQDHDHSHCRGHRQSLFEKNSSHSTRPIIKVSGPSSSGITNSPTQGMNTSIAPATMPARDNGHRHLQKAVQGVAPRSEAASSKRMSIFDRLAYSGRIMKGR